MYQVTQKLHTSILDSQAVDFIDYFTHVTIEWE